MNKCPQCGYVENLEIKQQHTIMNTYVDAKTGKVDGVYNSDENKIIIKGKELVKQALWKPEPTPAPKAPEVKK